MDTRNAPKKSDDGVASLIANATAAKIASTIITKRGFLTNSMIQLTRPSLQVQALSSLAELVF